jgi:hypothetical protein
MDRRIDLPSWATHTGLTGTRCCIISTVLLTLRAKMIAPTVLLTLRVRTPLRLAGCGLITQRPRDLTHFSVGSLLTRSADAPRVSSQRFPVAPVTSVRVCSLTRSLSVEDVPVPILCGPGCEWDHRASRADLSSSRSLLTLRHRVWDLCATWSRSNGWIPHGSPRKVGLLGVVSCPRSVCESPRKIPDVLLTLRSVPTFC